MENHVHFIIDPKAKEDLPRLMNWFMGVFAMRYNQYFKISGRLWGDRYFSRPILTEADELATNNYIDYNPVEAGLVSFPEEWRWGGYYHRATKRFDLVSIS